MHTIESSYPALSSTAETDSLIEQLQNEYLGDYAPGPGPGRISSSHAAVQYDDSSILAQTLNSLRDEDRAESLQSSPLRPPPLSISARNSPSSSPKRVSHDDDASAQWESFDGAHASSHIGNVPSTDHIERRLVDSPLKESWQDRTASMFSFDGGQEPIRTEDAQHYGEQRADTARPRQHGSQDRTTRDDLTVTNPLRRSLSAARRSNSPMSIFRDFDGVHDPAESSTANIEQSQDASIYSSTVDAEASQGLTPQLSDPAVSRPSSGYGLVRHEQRWVEPPEEGMVYYPAPVPRNLNMPSKLSQQANPATQAKRRSQVLGSMPFKARHSMQWLLDGEENGGNGGIRPDENVPRGRKPAKRKSGANMKTLPPQLRASLFFDLPSTPHEIEVKHQSAVATLDDMLDASADAPIDAFMGVDDAHLGRDRKSMSSMMTDLKSEHRMSRASLLSMRLDEAQSGRAASRASMLSGKRSASADNLSQLGKLEGRISRASMLSGKRSPSVDYIGEHAKRVSMLSLGDEVQFVDEADKIESRDGISHAEDRETPAVMDPERKRTSSVLDEIFDVGGEPTPEHGGDAEGEDEFIDEQALGPPTTLLAELQLRKAKLKQRTRTAATAYPNGMHSTLLQLEEVAQVEKRRRRKKPTTLAWEDPSARGTAADVDDEDVPLGVLFPERNGLLALRAAQNDWDKPLGLIEQSARENNETLAQRQLRLFGKRASRQPQPLHPWYRRNRVSPTLQQQQHSDDDLEHEGETLAQRTRRLRAEKGLDVTIGGGDDFASEMLSQFGGLEDTQRETLSPENDGETLGQRRRRLQAERDRASTVPRHVSSTLSVGTGPLSSSRQTSGGSQIPPLATPDANKIRPIASRERLANISQYPRNSDVLNQRVVSDGLPPILSDVGSTPYGIDDINVKASVVPRKPVAKTIQSQPITAGVEGRHPPGSISPYVNAYFNSSMPSMSGVFRQSTAGASPSYNDAYFNSNTSSMAPSGLIQASDAHRAASRERIQRANRRSSSGLRLSGHAPDEDTGSRSISPSIPSPGLQASRNMSREQLQHAHRRRSSGLRLSDHFQPVDSRNRSTSPGMPSPGLLATSEAQRAASRERIMKANNRSSSGLRYSQHFLTEDASSIPRSPGTPPANALYSNGGSRNASRELILDTSRRNSSGLRLNEMPAQHTSHHKSNLDLSLTKPAPFEASEGPHATVRERNMPDNRRLSGAPGINQQLITQPETRYQQQQMQQLLRPGPEALPRAQAQQQIATRSMTQQPTTAFERPRMRASSNAAQQPSSSTGLRRMSGPRPRAPSGRKVSTTTYAAGAMLPPSAPPSMKTALGMSTQDKEASLHSAERDKIDEWRMNINFEGAGDDGNEVDDKRSIRSMAFI